MLLADAVPELAAAAELLHQVDVHGVLKHVDQAHDAERAGEAAQHVDLAPDRGQVARALLVRRVVAELLADGLARVARAGRAVDDGAHDAVAALAELVAALGVVLGLEVARVAEEDGSVVCCCCRRCCC